MTSEMEPVGDFTLQFEGLINSLNNIKSQITVLQQQIKNMERNAKKEYKTLKKEVDKNKNKGNKNPSGFAKPTKVTDDLCKFMNREEGSEIARTDVTKALIHYIESNNLQNSENKKIIMPDEKLKTLLGLDEKKEVTLTYFNLQKYMNKHFFTNKKPLETVVIE
jgi:chromatin remodeling complex protein RSC6|uniref:DM2 domain-containing protein n=1 Tax=viral metagenome TaxID=1070528 RepID=A0A6C0HCI0_9ZZZZ